MVIKKSALIITFCVLMALLFENFAFAEAKTYYVESFDDLKTMEDDPDAYYVLTNNIMLEDPVEMLFCDRDKPFSGTLDGNGYAITGLKIESNAQEVAFIGYFCGTIRNLNLVYAVISGGGDCKNAGGLVYKNNGKIENCTFSGEIKIGNQVIRGTEIAAFNFGEIINCDIIRPNNSSSSSPDFSGHNNSSQNNDYQYTEIESTESSLTATSSLEMSYSSDSGFSSEDEISAIVGTSSGKTTTSSNIKNISSSSGAENKNESVSTSSKTSKTSSIKETTSVKDKSSSSKKVVTSSSKESETTTSQYGDRQELSNFFVSSDTEENQVANIPAAVMLGICAFALLFMGGFVVYKEIVSVTAAKKKKDNE